MTNPYLDQIEALKALRLTAIAQRKTAETLSAQAEAAWKFYNETAENIKQQLEVLQEMCGIRDAWHVLTFLPPIDEPKDFAKGDGHD